MKKILIGVLTTITFLSSASQSLAVDCSGAPVCGDANCPATLQCITDQNNGIFKNFLDAAVALVGVVAVILIIVAGYKYIMAAGDSKQVEDARKTLSYAIIGLVIVLFSFLILEIIRAVTGVPIQVMPTFSLP